MHSMRNVPVALAILAVLVAAPAFSQAPPTFNSAQLDQLVARIALYPDPLLAQILAAATYPNDIRAAAQWADEHHYLTGQALANAISEDQLPWDPSVQALLPFPSVLDMMNSDMNWTTQIGNAFLAQQQDVMDTVQRQRGIARRSGYLTSNGQIVVSGGPYITIMPVNPGYIVVPYYDPGVVFFAPRGWVSGGIRFDWGGHAVFLNNARWGRTWVNRSTYVHPYAAVRRPAPGSARPAEAHAAHPRSEPERNASRQGKAAPRETHREEHR